jgi:hypothetical protein
MTYLQNMNVHAQLYFAPLQTSQFLSFAATSIPFELMGDRCHQGAIRLYLHVSTKEKKERKLRSYLTRAVEHAAASVSASTESPPSMVQLLLPQYDLQP